MALFLTRPSLQRRFRVQLWPARPPTQVPAPSLLLSLICKRTGSFGTRFSNFALFSAWEDVARWRSPALLRHTPKAERAWEVLQWPASYETSVCRVAWCFSGRKLVQVPAGHWRSVCRVSRLIENCLINFFFASVVLQEHARQQPAGLT